MPGYVVYRPSVMRSGRLLVRAAAVAALLIAALTAFLVLTHGGGSAPAPRASVAPIAESAKARLAGAHAATAPGAGSHPRAAGTEHAVAKRAVAPVKKKVVKAAIPAPHTTPVAILNGGTAQGAAAALAARLRAIGYPVPVVGNAGRRDLPMAIEYSAGLGPAARALARHVGSVQYVTPLEGPNRNLSGARLLVIIGD